LGELPDKGECIDAVAAATAVKHCAKRFSVDSLMTFGGEPLLFADAVCRIHATARDAGIPRRQLITNGFFSHDDAEIDKVAQALCESGINDVMLSVDAFHQETIPVESVMQFANALVKYGIPSLRVHPAWVVNAENDNKYNVETKRLLKLFADRGIRASNGNNISLSGNASKYLAEYYPPSADMDLSEPCGWLGELNCISINPNGAVSACAEIGNIYNDDILDIIDNYNPYSIPVLREVMNGGVAQLVEFAKAQGFPVDISDCRSTCDVCRKIFDAEKLHGGEKYAGSKQRYL